jgi:hypothetical protein
MRDNENDRSAEDKADEPAPAIAWSRGIDRRIENVFEDQAKHCQEKVRHTDSSPTIGLTFTQYQAG